VPGDHLKVRSLTCLMLDTLGMVGLGRRLAPILLAQRVAEAFETPGIHGVAGLMRERMTFVTTRPC
jgi:hypothetical protein